MAHDASPTKSCIGYDCHGWQVVHYPAPEHRTAALAHQAAQLYLALYFVPGVLHREATLMRTLVDRWAAAPLLSCPPAV